MGRQKYIENKIEDVVKVVEIVIAILILIGIILGLVDMVFYFTEILQGDPAKSYDVFQSFLAYALLLIVGAELIFMLLYHSTNALLELVLFVIARKMLIYANTMLDLVLGTLALMIVYATIKYFVVYYDTHYPTGIKGREGRGKTNLPTSKQRDKMKQDP